MHYTNPPLENRIRSLASKMEPLPTGMPPRLRPLDDVRAVLFDIYGTLFISGSGDISIASANHDGEALTAALGQIDAGGDLRTAGREGVLLLEETIRGLHEERRSQGVQSPEVDILEVWRDVVEDMCDEGIVELDITEDKLEILAVEFECRVNPVWPMPGLGDLLAYFRETSVPLGIVSNAQFYTPLLFPALVGTSLDSLGFQADLCSFSYRMLEAKPSVRLFEKPLQVLRDAYGIQAGETVYVGNDRLNDVYTASLAGCRTVLFAGDRRSLRLRENDPRCDGLQADAVITDLRQLPDVLM